LVTVLAKKKYFNNVFIGIGSNLANAKENCLQGIIKLKETKVIDVIRCSSFYKTEPVGGPEQGWFVNCVVKTGTSFSPKNLLLYLKELEIKLGRIQSTRWGPRVIDFDILFFDDEIIDTHHLKIPHPLNHQRRFVLEPMDEIAPDLIHPRLKKSINELKKSISCENQKVERYNT
jgi:2-amino-4-hydroxy-6-hydroxymethyldihydropteridine diphosphokinase